jgi:hypothetical protein
LRRSAQDEISRQPLGNTVGDLADGLPRERDATWSQRPHRLGGLSPDGFRPGARARSGPVDVPSSAVGISVALKVLTTISTTASSDPKISKKLPSRYRNDPPRALPS